MEFENEFDNVENRQDLFAIEEEVEELFDQLNDSVKNNLSLINGDHINDMIAKFKELMPDSRERDIKIRLLQEIHRQREGEGVGNI